MVKWVKLGVQVALLKFGNGLHEPMIKNGIKTAIHNISSTSFRSSFPGNILFACHLHPNTISFTEHSPFQSCIRDLAKCTPYF